MLGTINRVVSATFSAAWYAFRPIGLMALPGTVDDASTWRGWLAMMPDWLWGLGLFLFGVWFCAAWYGVVLRALYPEWPDFVEIDKRNRFRLWEVACFWVDQPARLPLRGAAKRQFKKLAQAIRNQTLEVIREDLREVIYDAYDESRGHQVKPNPEWIITRKALLDYAGSINCRPRFLFPKERA